MDRRRLAALTLSLMLALTLPGCQSHTGQFLMNLTWELTKDAVKTLPFVSTAAFLLESVTSAVAKGETIGLAGILPAMDGNDVSLGVLMRFLPDYLREALEAAGINVELLSGTGPDGSSLVTLGEDGSIQLAGASGSLGGVDYVLSGVTGSQDQGLGIEIKLAPADGQGDTLFFGSSASYDADTLALMGANHVINPPLPVYAKCDAGPEMRKRGTADGLDKCEFVARAGADDNFLCVRCPGAPAGEMWSDPSGFVWKPIPSDPFMACMKVIPHGTQGSAGGYGARAEGPVSGERDVAGNSAVVLEPGTNYSVLAQKGDEYDIGLNISPFVHTGTNVPRRVAVFLSVDGVNSIGQKLTIPSQGDRWALNTGGTTLIPGWQMNDNVAKRFKFVSFGESVAVRLGAEQNVGQITVLLYAEQDRGCPSGPLCNVQQICPPRVIAPPVSQPFDEAQAGSGEAMPSGDMGGGARDRPGKAKAAKRPASASDDVMESEKLGTGEGEEIHRKVEHVDLVLEEEPIAVMTLHYRGEAVAVSDAPPFRIIAPPITY